MQTNSNHTKTVDDYKVLPGIHLHGWTAERIRMANYDLVNHIRQVLISNPAFGEIYGVDAAGIDHLRRNESSLRSLLGTPFLILAPSLTTIED